jgi:hypothetical protein
MSRARRHVTHKEGTRGEMVRAIGWLAVAAQGAALLYAANVRHR